MITMMVHKWFACRFDIERCPTSTKIFCPFSSFWLAYPSMARWRSALWKSL